MPLPAELNNLLSHKVSHEDPFKSGHSGGPSGGLEKKMRPDTSMPILKMEIEGVRRTMLHALQNSGEELREAAEKALDEEVTKYIDGDRIQQYVAELAAAHVQNAIEKTVRSYFEFGKGKSTLRKAVEDHLDTIFGLEPE